MIDYIVKGIGYGLTGGLAMCVLIAVLWAATMIVAILHKLFTAKGRQKGEEDGDRKTE